MSAKNNELGLPLFVAGMIAVFSGAIGWLAATGDAENQQREDFKTRTTTALTARGLEKLDLKSAFMQGAAGCAAPLYGVELTARSKDGSYVEGAVCISGATEVVFRPK